jgi:hypothetical protein
MIIEPSVVNSSALNTERQISNREKPFYSNDQNKGALNDIKEEVSECQSRMNSAM